MDLSCFVLFIRTGTRREDLHIAASHLTSWLVVWNVVSTDRVVSIANNRRLSCYHCCHKTPRIWPTRTANIMSHSLGLCLFKVLQQVVLIYLASAQAWMSTSVPRILTVHHNDDASNLRKNSKVPPPSTTTTTTSPADPDASIPHPVSCRREFLDTSLLSAMTWTYGTLLLTGKPANANAASSGDDPFAQLDSFASAISAQSSSASAPPSSPPPSAMKNMKDNSNDAANTNSPPTAPGAGLSEMEAALQQSRKQRRIDPRTHG